MEKWVPELFTALKNHPDFKDDKDWQELPSIHRLAKYLVLKVEGLKPKESDWVIQKHYGGGVLLTYYQTLHDYDFDATLSLEWLLRLEEQNPELGIIAITMMAMVARAWKLDVIVNEYTDMALQDPDANKTGDPDDDDRMERELKAYEDKGPVFKFRDRFEKLAVISQNKLIIDLMLFMPRNRKEEQIRDWLVAGVEVIDDPGVIGMYIWEPLDYNSEDCPRPVTAQEMFCYYWSFHDAVYKIATSWIDGTAREGGIVPATVQRTFTSSKKAYPICGKAQLDKLAKFMDLGRNVYAKYYRDFYVEKYGDDEIEHHT